MTDTKNPSRRSASNGEIIDHIAFSFGYWLRCLRQDHGTKELWTSFAGGNVIGNRETLRQFLPQMSKRFQRLAGLTIAKRISHLKPVAAQATLPQSARTTDGGVL